jgi:hypothetical protein
MKNCTRCQRSKSECRMKMKLIGSTNFNWIIKILLFFLLIVVFWFLLSPLPFSLTHSFPIVWVISMIVLTCMLRFEYMHFIDSWGKLHKILLLSNNIKSLYHIREERKKIVKLSINWDVGQPTIVGFCLINDQSVVKI